MLLSESNNPLGGRVTERAGVTYREIRPDTRLADLVDRFWILRIPPGAPAQTVSPDRSLQLLWSIQGQVRKVSTHGGGSPRPPSYVAGIRTGGATFDTAGGLSLVGAAIRPGAVSRILRVSPTELTDQWAGLDCFWGRDAGRLENQVREANCDDDRIAAIQVALLQRISDPRPFDNLVKHAVQIIVQNPAETRTGAIADTLRVSERTLQRRFLREVGVLPKWFARMNRFRNIFRLLRECPAPWARLAVSGGYSDQAHLVREFRAFASQPPTAFFDSPHREWDHGIICSTLD